MNIITIDKNNIDSEHICCAIGADRANRDRALSKKEWMKEQFDRGLVFKRFDQRGKIFIEYMPVEYAWKPVAGRNYMVINCLWVSGRFKGKGLSTQLLDECVWDSRRLKMDGIAVVSSAKVMPFLTDRKFFLKHGFETVDTAPPYFELLAMRFNTKAAIPHFTDRAKSGTCGTTKGFTFIYSNQCPFMEEYVGLLSGICRERNIPCQVKRLRDHREAQESGSPFGTLGIYYDGVFQTHELMAEKKFLKFIDEIV